MVKPVVWLDGCVADAGQLSKPATAGHQRPGHDTQAQQRCRSDLEQEQHVRLFGWKVALLAPALDAAVAAHELHGI
jgi:hypothetical protein